jgi:hypothetical protein
MGHEPLDREQPRFTEQRQPLEVDHEKGDQIHNAQAA